MRKIIFSKYSNDRADKFCIRTDICMDQNGKRFVEKIALSEKSEEHVNNIYKNYCLLKENFGDNNISFNRCEKKASGKIELEYLSGQTLEESLDELLFAGKVERVIEEIEKFATALYSAKGKTEFHSSEEFRNVFGKVELPQGLMACDISNIDILFSNIIVTDVWNILDYEWTFCFQVPINYIIYRAVSAYVFGLYSSAGRDKLNEKDIFSLLNISKEEIKAYQQMGANFEYYVMEGKATTKRIRELIGQRCVGLEEILKQESEKKQKETAQIFWNTGQGYHEEESMFLNAPNGFLCIELDLSKKIKNIRIDPASCSGLLTIKKLCIDGEQRIVQSNGYKFEQEDCILFLTDDPQIYINDIENGKKLSIDLIYQFIDESSCEIIQRQRENQQEIYTDLLTSSNREISNLKNWNSELIKEKEMMQKEITDLEMIRENLEMIRENLEMDQEKLQNMKNNLEKENIELNCKLRSVEQTKVWKLYMKYKKLKSIVTRIEE